MKAKVNETDRPLLKALIMMKSKQPELDLKKIPLKRLFDRNLLLKRLYE